MPLLSAFDTLDRALDGTLLLPSDDGFDAARRPWNLSIDQVPAAVATPAGLDDLRLILAAAREAGTPIAVQPSGHGASGDLAGAVIVRTAAFDRLDIDLAAGVVVVGSGVRWGAVVDALEGTGWAAPAGTSPVVSVAGYTLGGGHSWFSRTAGLGSDNLRAAWVLRPDGTHERIDDDSDGEAMWALRGAGGVVGVVTALEIDLVRAPAQWGASLTFDAADSAAVIRAVRDLAAVAPSTLNVFTSSMRMPDAPMLPEAIRGKSYVTVQALSSDGAAEALLDGVRRAGTVQRETAGPTSLAALAAASGEPTDPTPGRGASAALDRLDDATIDALVDFRHAPAQSTIIGIDLRMLGGALDAPRRSGFASLASAGWLLHALVPNFPGAPAEPGDASIAGLRELLAPVAAERTVPTFLTPGQSLERCATASDIDRLRAVRASADPDGVLHEGRLPR
ncbi:FAD-binding oxidoreductase [Microbacterium azadirachtae]|uniref:Mitomycin radical oxidase n=1 Tax=Microbacterium azadirachtae TaxID=582680 RepID=A0A0F0LDR8_9MICO|nr:FAD-binding protein [Microbacterium azadirachtae]KJL30829.1 Mitomycin radical oxidase [Microbacterium azadirachtae]